MPNAVLHLWHRIIGRDDEFYSLLEQSAAEVQSSVRLLTDYLDNLAAADGHPPLAALAESRRQQKQIREQTIAELNKSLVAPFDREDIQALAYALYRIPKAVERVMERLSIYPGRVPLDGFRRLAGLLSSAAGALEAMTKLLMAHAPLEEGSAANDRLQAAEGEADKLVLALLQELYSGPYSAKELIILRALFERVERAIDRCRTAGNIIVRMMLKSA